MYNLSLNDKKIVDLKLKKQEDYLKNNGLYNSSYSANIRPDKYISELYNRVNTIAKYCKFNDLKPIFITITAPSRFHPLSNNLPNPNYNGFSPSSTAKYLSEVWASFLNTNIISHECSGKRHYFRTYEPHKSGVPHIHALLYVPAEFIEGIKKAFVRCMNKEQIKQYKFLYEFSHVHYKDSDRGAIAYIMKYINKSFKNAKKDKMTAEAYWYAKHNIRRFLTSRSLIPVMMYRKMNYKDDFQDMLKMTRLYKNGSLIYSNDKDIYLVEYDPDECEIVHTSVFIKNPMYEAPKIESSFKYIPKRKQTPIFKRYVPIYKDGVLLNPKQKPVNKQSDQELFTTFHDFDIETCNLQKYGVYKNEMIKRGFISGEIESINDFNTDFGYEK